ncbi:MAG: DUF1549 domain-containing protein [Isosphaeraceae bacterium]|nr:DUF1549 domain-containing protein [Isosphaeraceae bacterium]
MMRTKLRWALTVSIGFVAAPARSNATELLSPDRPIDNVVDHYLDAKLAEAKVKPASTADDANVIRRLTLDLVGRIPTAAETRAYLDSTDPDKCAKLVDRLMTSPGFVRHQANEFNALLMAGTPGSARDYLKDAFQADRSWDQIFRDVMLADESDAGRKGSSAFLKPRAKDLDRLTSDVSSTFFGVNVSCAKCHDHPRVKDWKQDHFYGMKSFLNRTFENGDFLGERSYGVVKFKTTEGQEKQAKFMFLTGRTVDVQEKEPSKDEQKKERESLEEARKKKVAPPAPTFSARAKLVEVALQLGERDFFARAVVNRVWYRLFGHGLVMPLDQMHSENPPSHPELLEWLARDTIAHGYNLRRLTRGLVLSRAYARSSRWESGEPPRASLFAVANVRPLSPVQLTTSMWVAVSDPELFATKANPAEIEQRIEGLESRGQGLAATMARPGEDYSIGVSEALLMSNSDQLKGLLGEGGDRLLTRLVQTKDAGERIELVVRNVLSRPPGDDEGSLLGEFLRGHDDKPVEGCRQLLWALLTSAEFRFNY